jgi:hypothetical protein
MGKGSSLNFHSVEETALTTAHNVGMAEGLRKAVRMAREGHMQDAPDAGDVDEGNE